MLRGHPVCAAGQRYGCEPCHLAYHRRVQLQEKILKMTADQRIQRKVQVLLTYYLPTTFFSHATLRHRGTSGGILCIKPSSVLDYGVLLSCIF